VRLSCREDGIVEAGRPLVRRRDLLLDCCWESFGWTNRRPIDATDRAIGFALDRRCVESQELTVPP
jgi:hypothetical protein